LVNIDGELYILALPYSNITFRATFVKLYLTPITAINGIKVELANIGIEITSEEFTYKEPADKLTPLLVKRGKGRPRKNPNITVLLQDD
jgi:hypothetical protein